MTFQSTRPLRGATEADAEQIFPDIISIHAPLAGRDATFEYDRQPSRISIHAPLAGRDWVEYFLS